MIKFKRKQSWLVIFFLLIAAGLLMIAFSNNGTNSKSMHRKGKKNMKVDAFVVKPTLLINDITVNGSLEANESVNLENEVSGRIVYLNLPEGKYVKKGTLLVKLFDDDLQADLHKYQAQLAIQEQIYKRQKQLLKVNGITQNEYEQNGLQIQTLKADIEAQKAQIRKTEVLAPFDGYIGLRDVSIGAIVNSSTLLATIRTIKKLKLDFYIPEKYSPFIKNGMDVNFSLAGSNKNYHATVYATEEGIDNSTRNLKVRAEVKGDINGLLPGEYANVHLVLSKNPKALMIPTEAIIPQETNKSVIVARNGKAQFVKITTGVRKVATIEVTNGLQAGDTIITTGIMFLRNGSHLTYSSIK